VQESDVDKVVAALADPARRGLAFIAGTAYAARVAPWRDTVESIAVVGGQDLGCDRANADDLRRLHRSASTAVDVVTVVPAESFVPADVAEAM